MVINYIQSLFFFLSKHQVFLLRVAFFLIPILCGISHDTTYFSLLVIGPILALDKSLKDLRGVIYLSFKKYILFYLLLAYIFASIFWSPNPFITGISEFIVLTILLFCSSISLELAKTYRDPKLFKFAFYGFLIAILMYVINCFTASSLEYILSFDLSDFEKLNHYRKYGKEGRIFLLFFALFAPYLFLKLKVYRFAFLYGLIIFATFWLEQNSNNIAVFSMLFALVSYQLFKEKTYHFFLGLFIFFLLCSPFLIYVLFDALALQKTFPYLYQLATRRIDIWLMTIDLISQKWLFGWGVESFRVLGREAFALSDVHNFFLGLFLDLGLIGILIMCGISYQLFIAFKKYQTKTEIFVICSILTIHLVIGSTWYPITREWWTAALFLISVCFVIFAESGQYKEKNSR